MGLAITHTRTNIGIRSIAIAVEVHIARGLPGFVIVGLPETAVRESKDRVRCAITNSQFEFPLGRITVNLSPANLPKSGSGFDLAIALAILIASRQLPSISQDFEFVAELALTGELRGVHQLVPMALGVKQASHTLIIAEENEKEVVIINYDDIFKAKTLREVCHHFQKISVLERIQKPTHSTASVDTVDWSEVKGQQHAKKAMIIAASGGHSILLSGPPGSGKTMLAKRFMTLLPALSEEKALEVASVHALRNQTPSFETWRIPPFRSPHHTASAVALAGGGNPPKPGEISLAHHGVLFLDELPEFQKHALETLREPLESGSICISRAAMPIEFPAQFQLIAAMNPCPCGQAGHPANLCHCPSERIQHYLGKISGPILDRIDLQITVQPLSQDELLNTHTPSTPESPTLRKEIERLHTLQLHRQKTLNAHLTPKSIETHCHLNSDCQKLMTVVLSRLLLSARGFHRILKVARTIADLSGESEILPEHLKEALSYRQNIRPC